MEQIKGLSPVFLGLFSLLSSSVYAADALPLQKIKLNDLQKQFQLDVPGLKSSTLTTDSLHYLREHRDNNGVSHIRMQQRYKGFDVFGGYAIIHAQSRANQLLSANPGSNLTGTVYSGLSAELGDKPDDYIQKAQNVLEDFLRPYQGVALEQQEVRPLVFIDNDHKAHWAYQVSAIVNFTDKTPQKPTAIIDAKTMQSFIEWNDMQTHSPVKGMGFGGNTKTGEIQYGKDFPLLDLTRDDSKALCFMETEQVKVVDMLHLKTSDNLPIEFACPDDENHPGIYWTGYKGDGYDSSNGAYSPANDALYVGHVIKRMYQDWYQTNVLVNSDGQPMQLVMRVHYKTNFQNAHWDGQYMSFGDGAEMLYPLVSIGIGAHEVSHGFTQQHSGLIYYGYSGGLNESFSDMAAQIAELYATGSNNWHIGSEVLKEGAGIDTLRYMDQPSKDGQSIDTADGFYFGMDVHYSSGVYNRMFYLLSTSEGWDPKKAFEVMVKANMDYWAPWTTFDESSCGILNAAQDLGYELKSIKSALSLVAVNYNQCEI